MPKLPIKRISVLLPKDVYDAITKLSKKKLTSVSTEGAKAIVDRLKEEGYLDKKKDYL